MSTFVDNVKEKMKEKIRRSYWYTYLTLGRYTKRRPAQKSQSMPNLKAHMSPESFATKLSTPTSTPTTTPTVNTSDDDIPPTSPAYSTFSAPYPLGISKFASFPTVHSAPSSPTSGAAAFPLPGKAKRLAKYRSMNDVSGADAAPAAERNAEKRRTWLWEKDEEVDPEFVRSSEAYNSLKRVPYVKA
ncbi:hypothetical protein BC829DRAFT_258686 [Chytridium lagenaria]|nr:hypothetical protein BC829DRAFT_258686 [Chytridium lagenaria]